MKSVIKPLVIFTLLLSSHYLMYAHTDQEDYQHLREKIFLAQKDKLLAKLEKVEKSPKQIKRAHNPFHGWWEQVSKGNNGSFGFGGLTDDTDSYIFIDTDAMPYITISSLAGTPTLPRERTNLDGTITMNMYYQPDPDSLVNVIDIDGPLFDPIVGQSAWSLKLQPDGETLVASTGSRAEWTGFEARFNLYKKIDEPPFPVRPFNGPQIGFGSVNDPVEIARQIYSSQLLNQLEPQNENFNDGDYRTFAEREVIFQQFLDGFEVTTPIREVRISQPGRHFVISQFSDPVITFERTTDIFTDIYSLVTVGSTVEIGGFEGPWAALNGVYVNGVAFNEEGAVPNPRGSHLDSTSAKSCREGTWNNVFNHFLLDFDSSDSDKFPADKLGYAKFCGCPWVKVRHHIRSDMEYPELVAAIEAMFYSMYRVSQHCRFTGYFPINSIFLIDTFNELQTSVAANNFNRIDFTGRTNQALPSGFFNNSIIAERLITTYNDPFSLSQEPDSYFDYNIVLANYIKNPKTLFWAIEGTPDLTPVAPNGEPLQFNPTDVGYKQVVPSPDRAAFIGALGDINVVDGKAVAVNPNPAYFVAISSIDPNNNDRSANSYYVGLIDPKLTSGKKIGYLRWLEERLNDPIGYMGTSTFAPDVPVTIKYGREAMLKVFSNFTKFFNENHCDAVILDIRSNNGGFAFNDFNLAEFFGDDRAGYTRHFAKKDIGDSDLIDYNDYNFFQNIYQQNIDSFARFYVRQNEQNYPGSVFKGSKDCPKKVIILTDSGASSAGDIFPHFFLGENLDGQLGSYTTAEIIGDIDGRLKGAATFRNPPPVSADNNLLYDENGDPFPIIRFSEDLAWGVFLNGLTDIYFNQQTEGTAPSRAPTLKGKAGGNPLPNDWQTNAWVGLGLVDDNCRVLTHLIPKGKPDYNNRSSWRDPWLEQAILAAMKTNCPKKTKVVCKP